MNFLSKTISVCLEVYGCCGLEVENIFSSMYNHIRPWTLIPSPPDQAEVLLVSGWLNLSLQAQIKSKYEQLKGHRKVIALGVCQISGSVYQGHQQKQLVCIDQILPVSVFVPGCPPSPEQIISGITLALDKDIHISKRNDLTTQKLMI